ncbi:response regulator [bacterium]|nr:response regulator [bacterium]
MERRETEWGSTTLLPRRRTIMAQRYRILAVDDNEDTLELIRLTLMEEYDVLTLSNPMDIYELLEVFEPDLLILDVMMPKITGFQLVEMLQKSNATRNLPIIILSAKNSAREIKHGYKLGASLYLTKPFQPERLAKNVKTQFEVHPPASARKSLNLEQVLAQLQLKVSYRQGYAQIASADLRVDEEEARAVQQERERRLRQRFDRHPT